MNYEDTQPREQAIQRLNNRRAFATHLVTFFAVNAMLILLWAATGAGYFWPIWPLIGWGVGLALHAWTVYGQRPITEEEIRREMQSGL